MMSELYGDAFFAQMKTCEEAYRRLGECVDEILPEGVHHIWDFGSGLGYLCDVLEERGRNVYLVDLYAPAASHLDLCQPIFLPVLDVVVCTETAEHLPPESADILVRNVAWHAGEMIVWSAAPPGQAAGDSSATGHINEQPPEYWLEKFADYGWKVDDVKTAMLRALMWERKAQHMYCKDSFYCLVPD
jgi:hypothetical protein